MYACEFVLVEGLYRSVWMQVRVSFPYCVYRVWDVYWGCLIFFLLYTEYGDAIGWVTTYNDRDTEVYERGRT